MGELIHIVPRILHDTAYNYDIPNLQTIVDIIQRCKKDLFPVTYALVQGWALMEAAGYSFLKDSKKEELCVILHCRKKSQLCVARYAISRLLN